MSLIFFSVHLLYYTDFKMILQGMSRSKKIEYIPVKPVNPRYGSRVSYGFGTGNGAVLAMVQSVGQSADLV
jgi:hypothetical protein